MCVDDEFQFACLARSDKEDEIQYEWYEKPVNGSPKKINERSTVTLKNKAFDQNKDYVLWCEINDYESTTETNSMEVFYLSK